MERQHAIKVVIADDSFVIRQGLESALAGVPDIEVVDVCANGNELLDAIARHRPDVVIADIRMPPSGDAEGIRVATRLRDTNPELGVVVLSHYLEPSYAVSLLSGGTGRRAYLLKDRIRDRSELQRAIRSVDSGGSVVDPAVVDVLVAGHARMSDSRLSELTAREREILAGIAEGKSNAAIAAELVLTKRAVEKHVNSIFTKLDLPGPEDVSRRVAAALLFLDDKRFAGPPP